MAAMCNGLAFADDSEWRHLDKKMETLHQQKQYPQAIIAAEKAVRLAETRFGPNHEFLARSLSGLGLFNEDQGRYPEAERSYLRALAIYETTRGPDHLDIATILSRLGIVAPIKSDTLKRKRTTAALWKSGENPLTRKILTSRILSERWEQTLAK